MLRDDDALMMVEVALVCASCIDLGVGGGGTAGGGDSGGSLAGGRPLALDETDTIGLDWPGEGLRLVS